MAINLDFGSLTTTCPFNPKYVSPWKDIKRVILNPDGSEAGELDENNSNLWADGTAVDWSAVEASGQNVMVKIPKFYIAKLPYNITGAYTSGHIILISNTPQEDFVLHPAFMRCRDKLTNEPDSVAVEVSHRYASAFLGSIIEGKLRSLPFKDITRNLTINDFRLAAVANGVGWGLFDFNLFYALQCLYLVEHGSCDSQTKVGFGVVETTAPIATGSTMQYGNGTSPNGLGRKTSISYHGIEDLWGNCNRFIDGVCRLPDNKNVHIGNTYFNNEAIGYTPIPNTTISSNLSGQIKSVLGDTRCGFIAEVSTGVNTTSTNATQFMCDDASNAVPINNKPNCMIVGGYWGRANAAGIFHHYLALDVTTYKQSETSASLSY